MTDPVKKYDIIITSFNQAWGAEKLGIRPALVLQNNLVNQSKIKTIIVAPFTSSPKEVPSAQWVIATKENGLKADSRLEFSQIQAIDRGRITKALGQLETKYYKNISEKITNFLDLRDEYI